MNESNPSDDALAELLSLTVEVTRFGSTTYRNHLGQEHRVHGPAVIYSDGDERWYQNGLRHRTDGPAVIYPDSGGQYWFLNGHELTEDQFNERVKSM